MSHNVELIFTLTGGLTAALLLGFIAQWLRLSPLVGYLVAGIAIGPFTPGFVAHSGVAEQFAEIGVILLLFGVGLQFHIRELVAVRRVVVPGAVLQVAIAVGLGVLITRAFGWSPSGSFVYGLAISVASTVVVLRVLSDSDALHTPAGHAAIAWLVVQDILTVLVLVMLPLVVGPRTGTPAGGPWLPLGFAVLKVAALVIFALFVGRRLLPALLGRVAKTRSRELFTLSVLVLALGIAVGSATLFGASMALGAFLAGMVVGQSEFSSRAASEALPMRDAFAVLFFVSMGMLLDPTQLLPNARLIGATAAVVMFANPLAAFGLMLIFGAQVRTAVTVSLTLAQIGEFSFILAALGKNLGILPPAATQALVATSILSITLNPLLFKLADPITRWLSARLRKTPSHEATPAAEEAGRRTILVGYGPVGRTLSRLLRENGVEPTVIELNHETVKRLNEEGVRAIYGDASQREILKLAGVAGAGSLVFAASGSPDAVIREAKRQNPGLRVLARATYIGEVPALERAGANVVVPAETEVALAMTEHLLSQLGATYEQLDRARDRARRELEPERRVGGDAPG